VSYQIRCMSRAEIDIAVDWAAAESWNPGLYDAECFHQADNEGFLVGLKDGQPVACISVVKYDESFAFLGFYIVKPEFRGQGLGLEIWNTGIQRLAGCNVGLDGVIDQQENYRKSGFTLAYNNMRFEGVTGEVVSADSDILISRNPGFAEVTEYDAAFFPADRGSFLTSWLQQPQSVVLASIDGKQITGYGMIRQCRNGFKIGPLFADNAKIANILFNELLASVAANKPVYLDVCEQNPAALEMAQRHGMKCVFETARMYTGKPPSLPFDRLYGVTSFELG
jgi:GNAT superfamily N-acetyltransferase